LVKVLCRIVHKLSSRAMAASPYDEENIFAKIIEGKEPSFKVYETKTSLAFLDKFPQAEGHVVIVPKAKGSTCFLNMKLGRETYFFRDLQKVSNAVLKAFSADGVNVSSNNGSAAGQTIFHAHFHIIPRFTDDKFAGKSASEMLTEEAAAPILAKLQEALKPPPKPLKKPKFGKVAGVKPQAKGLNLRVKLLEAPSTVEGQGKTFREVLSGDASGSVVLSLGADQMPDCKEGDTIEVRNGRAIMVKGHIRVGVDKWGKIEASEEELDEVNKDKNISAVEYELVA